ncbi:MAG: hypothetical protein ACKO6I_03840, partial [Sphingomonadales bacterium]
MQNTKNLIEEVWNDRSLLQKQAYIQAIETVIGLLDAGELRVAEPLHDGNWQ